MYFGGCTWFCLNGFLFLLARGFNLDGFNDMVSLLFFCFVV